MTDHNDNNNAEEDFKKAALHYHKSPRPGKIAIKAIKPMGDQRDLSLAYSPGVAYPCEAIAKDPLTAFDYTSKGNLVAVISNGTAVLGLGNIGALAGKPVMEGKGVLFKKFSDIDVFDIEIDEQDPDKFIDIVASLEPTFGGINLEDIKAPECFHIETELKKRMKIPVFHDDQHGTAIIAAAGVLNGLKLVNKSIENVMLVCSGAGAAAIACVNLLVSLGLKKEHILMCDKEGVINHKRAADTLDIYKKNYQRTTDKMTMMEAIENADIFLGVSGPGALTADMAAKMAENPLIFALANPEPEIRPELALAVRPDAIIATGRSDYPNQINNVLCFPYLFRGALDCGATEINEPMKLACVKAIAELAQKEPTEELALAHKGESIRFGRNCIIPKPFDPRLIVELPLAVAKAAMESGVALRPIQDLVKYREELTTHVFRTSLIMKPLLERAKKVTKTVAYCEGEDERVLRAVHIIKQENLANPILIGRPEVIEEKLKNLSIKLDLKVLKSYESIEKNISSYVQVVDFRDPPHLDACVKGYYKKMQRKGLTFEWAKQRMLTRSFLLSGMLLDLGYVDGQISGVLGQYHHHIGHLIDTVGLKKTVNQPTAISLILSPKGPLFFCDTHINEDPDPKTLAQITQMAAEIVRRFGITPKAALLSHSNFGSRQTKFSSKMQATLDILRSEAPELECEGEMQPEMALFERYREQYFPDSALEGAANLFIFANIDSANVAYNFVKSITDSVIVAPIVAGFAKPAHVLTNIATTRRIINMTAVCVTEE